MLFALFFDFSLTLAFKYRFFLCFFELTTRAAKFTYTLFLPGRSLKLQTLYHSLSRFLPCFLSFFYSKREGRCGPRYLPAFTARLVRFSNEAEDRMVNPATARVQPNLRAREKRKEIPFAKYRTHVQHKQAAISGNKPSLSVGHLPERKVPFAFTTKIKK